MAGKVFKPAQDVRSSCHGEVFGEGNLCKEMALIMLVRRRDEGDDDPRVEWRGIFASVLRLIMIFKKNSFSCEKWLS